MKSRNNWTREETLLAFYVYSQIPFKESSQSHPLIIEYARIIGRTPAALNMKIGNLGRHDPELKKQGISGLTHGSKLEVEVWAEFEEDWPGLVEESQKILEKYRDSSQAKIDGMRYANTEVKARTGLEVTRTVKQRVGQNFFRAAVLSAYYSRCCITGLDISELLIASHIVPWSVGSEYRLNPRNGLCLNALHDKAYDRGLLTVTPDYVIKISSLIEENEEQQTIKDCFLKYQDKKITLPDKFRPMKECLEYHYTTIFKK